MERCWRPHLVNQRLADPVPVLQRSLDIPLQEVNGSQEIVRVRIVWVNREPATKPGGCAGQMLLFVRDAGQLNREPLIAGCRTETFLQHTSCVFPSLQM